MPSSVMRTDPHRLSEELRQGKRVIAVVGLGHVGLPLALLFAEAGAQVIGCDTNSTYLSKLRQGISPIVEHSGSRLARTTLGGSCPNCGVRILKETREAFCPNCLRVVEISPSGVRLTGKSHSPHKRQLEGNEMQTLLKLMIKRNKIAFNGDVSRATNGSDAVMVCVGTPIDEKKEPNLEPLVGAIAAVGNGLRRGQLVVVKSTVSPGTTTRLVVPLLEKKSGLKAGRDFGVAHVPETTLEGLALLGYRTLPKTVGGIDERSALVAAGVFSLFNVPIHVFDSPTVTEAAKLFQNIYRDVNIALSNELALASEALGVDVMRVIEAALTEPKTHMLTPGPGVGGYCLPKDTYYLTVPARLAGFAPRILATAREVNNGMPDHVADLLQNALAERGMRVEGSTVAVLGVAFKANTADVRDSPAMAVINLLSERGLRISVTDPLVDLEGTKFPLGVVLKSKRMATAVRPADSLILLTDHLEYRELSPKSFHKLSPRLKVVVDTRHVFDAKEVIKQGYSFRGVGSGAANLGIA